MNTTKKIDFVAFAQLRPGASYEDCKSILLRHWRPLTARDEGFVWFQNFGCFVRVDKHGALGEVAYFNKFPTKRVIAGLRIGMAMDEARTIYPDLMQVEVDAEDATRYQEYRTTIESGYTLTVRGDAKSGVGYIAIANPHAEYPRKEDFDFAAKYPAPEAEMRFFKDGMFKLAVLQTLMDDGHIDLGEPAELASFVFGRYIDFDKDATVDGYDVIVECQRYLLHYPLTDALLAQVEEVYIEASMEIYEYIFRYWGGEGGIFDVTSLRGAECMPNLKLVSYHCMAEFSDEEEQYNTTLQARGIVVEDQDDE